MKMMDGEQSISEDFRSLCNASYVNENATNF